MRFLFWELLVEALRLEEVDGDDFAGIVITLEAVQRPMCLLSIESEWTWDTVDGGLRFGEHHECMA